MGSALLEKLRKADQLPTAPGVALRIVELNKNEEVDIDDLSSLISQDPALVAKVIKTANSGMFGMPREVASIRQAVLVLGIRTVNLLALSFSVIGASSGRAAPGFSYRTFWTHAAGTAIGSRMVAERVARDACDEAFLAGLLSRFGQLVLAECAAKDYQPVFETREVGVERIWEAERRVLGTTHMEVGAALLDDWGLPAAVCGAIAHHREPDTTPEEAGPVAKRLAEVVQFTAEVAGLLTGADVETAVRALREIGSSRFGFDASECSEIVTRIQEAIPAVAETLGLELEDEGTLVALRTQATELLLEQSLALQQQVQTVEARVVTDPLTGLRNRGFFDEAMAENVARTAQGGCDLGLLMIDLDHFKSVNDDHGHVAGDELLRAVARAIEQAAGARDATCRFGGEEFAVICPGTGEGELRERAEAIRHAIGGVAIETDRGKLSRTASIGGCFAPAGARVAVDAIVRAADRELYRAKGAGRDRCAFTRMT